MHRKRRIGRKFKSMRPVDDRKLRNGRKFETEAFEAERSQQRPQEASSWVRYPPEHYLVRCPNG
jgi:hypothetical protein